jgi:hypothetical protein
MYKAFYSPEEEDGNDEEFIKLSLRLSEHA